MNIEELDSKVDADIQKDLDDAYMSARKYLLNKSVNLREQLDKVNDELEMIRVSYDEGDRNALLGKVNASTTFYVSSPSHCHG